VLELDSRKNPNIEIIAIELKFSTVFNRLEHVTHKIHGIVVGFMSEMSKILMLLMKF